MTEQHFFTIGYQGLSLDEYLRRLKDNNIKLLCDVRRNPISRKRGFSKTALLNAVQNIGIKYTHLPELGIHSDHRQTLKTQEDYDRLFEIYEETTLRDQQEIFSYFLIMMKTFKRVAITCFEASVGQCHRGVIAKNLTMVYGWKYPISHL